MSMHRLNDDLNPRNERQTDARRVTADDNDTYTVRAHVSFYGNSDDNVRS